MSSHQSIEQQIEQCQRFYKQGDPQKALTIAEQALENALVANDRHLIATAAREVAQANRWLGRYQIALDNIHTALRMWSDLGDEKNMARASVSYCRVLMDVGLSDEAYVEVSKALKWAKANNDTKMMIRALDLQAAIMVISENFEQAEKLLNQTNKLLKTHHYPKMNSILPLHFGLLHTRMGDAAYEHGDKAGQVKHYQEAWVFTDQALAAAEEIEDMWMILVSLCNAAEIAAVLGDFEHAQVYFDKYDRFDNCLIDLHKVHYYYTKSEIAQRSGAIDQAVEYGQLALAAAESHAEVDNMMNAFRHLAEAHEALGDYKSAYDTFKRFHFQYKKQIAQQGQWQAKVAEYRSEVREVRSLLKEATVRADKMTEAAFKDSLTGLANRRSFDTILRQYETNPASGYSIAVIDLDHFKKINDRFSHLVGDDVLRFAADCMAENVREGDMVARVGGEEFAVFMPNTTQNNAILVCERIRQTIESWAWSEIAEGLAVSISVGVAMSREERSPMDVYAIADSRLYHAKMSGRNRVEALAQTSLSREAMRWS